MIEVSCVEVMITFRNEFIKIRWKLSNFCFIKNTQLPELFYKAPRFKTLRLEKK